MKFLNLGSGLDYRESTEEIKWVNLDCDRKIKADIYTDLEKNFPVRITLLMVSIQVMF